MNNEKKKEEQKITKKKTVQEQAEEVLRIAEECGVQSNFFFLTTFKRYQVQMTMLNLLEKAMTQEGVLVDKEYVKGRKNLYANPAVAEYNKTSTAANNTVSTLINIVKSLRPEDAKGTNSLEEEMNKLMNG